MPTTPERQHTPGARHSVAVIASSRQADDDKWIVLHDGLCLACAKRMMRWYASYGLAAAVFGKGERIRYMNDQRDKDGWIRRADGIANIVNHLESDWF